MYNVDDVTVVCIMLMTSLWSLDIALNALVTRLERATVITTDIGRFTCEMLVLYR